MERVLIEADFGVRGHGGADPGAGGRGAAGQAQDRGRSSAGAREPAAGHARRTERSRRARAGRAGPTVILMVGVNGTGKTTTAAKLARRLQREGRKVLLAAADTYRAGAIAQLQVWAERLGIPCVAGAPGGDPGRGGLRRDRRRRVARARYRHHRYRRPPAHPGRPDGGAAQGRPGHRPAAARARRTRRCWCSTARWGRTPCSRAGSSPQAVHPTGHHRHQAGRQRPRRRGRRAPPRARAADPVPRAWARRWTTSSRSIPSDSRSTCWPSPLIGWRCAASSHEGHEEIFVSFVARGE